MGLLESYLVDRFSPPVAEGACWRLTWLTSFLVMCLFAELQGSIFDIIVCSDLTLLSTIFQSYHDAVWLRQGAQCSLLPL